MGCPDDPVSPMPPPSGNTQTQTTLMVTHKSKNGQPVSKAVALTTAGALKLKVTNPGFTGAATVSFGSMLNFTNGRRDYIAPPDAPVVPVAPRSF